MVFDVSDLTELFTAILDCESVSGNEQRLADEVEATLRIAPHLEVIRSGNAVVARTSLNRSERVVIAGHLDTVPVAGNLPAELIVDDRGVVVRGRGAADMKGGIAVMVKLAVESTSPTRDVTWIFYDCEEIDQASNGLGRLANMRPDLLDADLAILMEPTSVQIEGGCQGTMRFDITTTGRAAHSARSWLGHNAIHDAAEVIDRVRDFDARHIDVDGLVYREGLNVTQITGGVAGNVIPDSCTFQVNYRFAPDKSPDEALAAMRELFAGYDLEIRDLSPAARPGLELAAAADFVRAVGVEPKPKYGWTDVARFSALGIPAVNYGPGDPGEAHTDAESCPIGDLTSCFTALQRWLS